MAASRPQPELLVIAGPTASGKSDLALRLAKEFGGEIITADSRTIYKGMDIGTAKPTKEEQMAVTHWGLDLVDPGQSYSAYEFKNYANKKIKEISGRDHLPVMVGGTGLYIDSVLFDFEFGSPADLATRQKLEAMNIDQLQAMIREAGYVMPANSLNKRHLIRTLERQGQLAKRGGLRPGTVIIGLDPGTEALKQRIDQRVEEMFFGGFIEEVKALLDKYGKRKILSSAGIGSAIEHIKGHISLEDAKQQLKKDHWQYARRQRTWFRRHPFIQWYADANTAEGYLRSVLGKSQ